MNGYCRAPGQSCCVPCPLCGSIHAKSTPSPGDGDSGCVGSFWKIDIHTRSAPVAQALQPPGMTAQYRTGDLFAWPEHEPVDLVISSLVTHHMDDAEIVRFVRWMEAHARLGWLVNDLHRHGFSYRGYPLLARLARWHPIVRHDGTLSIARSYRPSEWPPILAEAGIQDARVSRYFPFRLCVERVCER